MTKPELIQSIREKTGLSKKDTEKAVNAALESIQETLVKGEPVNIIGFGTFMVREAAERKGRNPSTGEEVVIPASKRVGFKPGRPLKEAVK